MRVELFNFNGKMGSKSLNVQLTTKYVTQLQLSFRQNYLQQCISSWHKIRFDAACVQNQFIQICGTSVKLDRNLTYTIYIHFYLHGTLVRASHILYENQLMTSLHGDYVPELMLTMCCNLENILLIQLMIFDQGREKVCRYITLNIHRKSKTWINYV